MTPRLPQLREDVANAITFHPGNRTGTPEQRHPVSLMLADAVLRVARPCTCDGDLIECSHEAARKQVEEENRRLRAERDALKASITETMKRYAAHVEIAHPTRPHDPDCGICRVCLPLSRDLPRGKDDREDILARLNALQAERDERVRQAAQTMVRGVRDALRPDTAPETSGDAEEATDA